MIFSSDTPHVLVSQREGRSLKGAALRKHLARLERAHSGRLDSVETLEEAQVIGDKKKFRVNTRLLRKVIELECDPDMSLVSSAQKAAHLGILPAYYHWLLGQTKFLIAHRTRVNELMRIGDGLPKLVLYRKAREGQPWAMALYLKMIGAFEAQSESSRTQKVLDNLTDWLNGKTDTLASPEEDASDQKTPAAEKADEDIHIPVMTPDAESLEEDDPDAPKEIEEVEEPV